MEKQPIMALLRIAEYSKDVLCEIYDRVNSWQWDGRLGDMPEDFENLPDYNWKWYHRLLRRKSKMKYIHPICEAIRDLVGEKELLRYHHLHNLGSTNEEFEKFWAVCRIENATGMVLYPFKVPDNVSRDNSCNDSQEESHSSL